MTRTLSIALVLSLSATAGCNKIGIHPDQPLSPQPGASAPQGPWINVLVPAAARRIGAAIPVQISVAVPPSDAGAVTQACVMLAAGPGTLRPVFPGACTNPGTTGNQGSSAPDGADASTPTIPVPSGLGTFESPAPGCVGLQLGTGGNATGSNLAIYAPSDHESIVTLIAGLMANADCTGPPQASVAVVIDLTPPAQQAADAGADATADIKEDAGEPLPDTSDGGKTSDSSGSDAGSDAGPTRDGSPTDGRCPPDAGADGGECSP